MTITQTLKAIRALGMRASWRRDVQEYRVSFSDLSYAESESSAYYTSDPDDALATAKHMRNNRVSL